MLKVLEKRKITRVRKSDERKITAAFPSTLYQIRTPLRLVKIYARKDARAGTSSTIRVVVQNRFLLAQEWVTENGWHQ